MVESNGGVYCFPCGNELGGGLLFSPGWEGMGRGFIVYRSGLIDYFYRTIVNIGF